MPCVKNQGDYLCVGWRQRAASIRARDSERCRGCNRSSDEVRLEVHHRRYGNQGSCGSCVLTGVTDDDLTTLCKDCHDAITSTRRGIRYAKKEIKVDVVKVQVKPAFAAKPQKDLPDNFIPKSLSKVGLAAKRSKVW